MGHYSYYGGDGYGGLKESCMYQVKYGNDGEKGKSKLFNNLTDARKFFDEITGEGKALWDYDHQELIDCYTWND